MCVIEYCSDGVVNNNEEWDDSNLVDGDGWTDTWINEFCGDNVVNNNGEQWDDGNLIDGDGWSSAWVTEYWGDTVVNNNGEQWDDGNQVNGDGWSSTWVTEYWGDGIKNNNNEEWDDGNSNDGDGWSSTWINEFWGDGTVNNNNSEQWDDGNQINGDGWTSTWINEYWGDGVVNNINEQWDDRNQISGDGWSSTWVTEYCGDGIINNNNEQWDDNKAISGDGWSSLWVIESWGDGLVNNNNEECDDNNTSKDDGCNQACVIEEDYIWGGGSLTSSSVCTKCSSGYISNSNRTQCVEDKLDNQGQNIFYVTIAMVVIGTLFNISNLLLGKASFGGVFWLINLLQMILIIPMIGAYISNAVTIFIVSFTDSLFSLSYFMPFDVPSIINLIDIDYPQKSSYMKLIDFTSGSSLINLQASIMLFIWLFCISIIVILIHMITRKYEESKWLPKTIRHLHKTLIFNLYITYIIESFVLYCVTWFYEISHFDNSQNKAQTSGYISIAMAWLLAIFILIGLIQWLKARNIEQYDELYYFRNYFAGIKKTNWARLYAIIFLLRRLILVLIITFGHDMEFMIKLGLFWVIQVWYISVIFICRFHIICDHNINESICEWCYFVLLVILFFINKEHDWNKTNERMYMYIIAGNSILYMIISAIAFLFNLQKVWWRKSNKKKVFTINLTRVRKDTTVNTNLSSMNRSKGAFINTHKNDGSSTVTHFSHSYIGTKNRGLKSDIAETYLKDKNDFMHKNNQLVDDIRKNKAKRKDQFIANRLVKLTHQELKKFEDISHQNNSNLKDLW